jgi:hypothetical protein
VTHVAIYSIGVWHGFIRSPGSVLQQKNLSPSYFSVRAAHESVTVSSNSISSQEPVASVVLNVHPQKSCTSQNSPVSLAQV